MTGRDAPVLLFDGGCAMCNHAVRRVLRLDRAGVFRFAPLEGETASQLIPADSPVRAIDSVVLVDGDGAHVRSESVLRVLFRLGGGWRLVARVLRLIPRGLRDAAYDFVASQRTRWFGRVETCALLTPEERNRILP